MHALDVVGHRAFLGDFVDEAFDFGRLTPHFHFHGAIGHVADRPNHFESLGEILAGIAETDSLDSAFKNYASCAHGGRMIG